jgi:hypothetical protein
VRVGDYDVRPVGGRAGCAAMIILSLVASVVLTVLLNAAFRLLSR